MALLLVAILPFAAGCQLVRGDVDCLAPKAYQSAREAGPLRAPEGLNVPAQRPDRRIPDINPSAGSDAGRCLDQPPQVLSNETVLALADPKARKKRPEAARPALPWPEVPATGWISIDPLEGADLSSPLRTGLPAWQVHDTLQAWADAWSRQETEPYFAFYAGNFVPDGGVSWPEWKAQRRGKVVGESGVDVSVYGGQAQALGPERVIVRFTERYRSDAGATVRRKEMLMVREGDVWSILRERESQ